MRILLLVVAIPTLGVTMAAGQQVPDTVFAPTVASPAFRAGTGPTVLLDEAHHNFHTLDGRYSPFGRLLRGDGFVVLPNRDRFTLETLAKARIMVIANAVADSAEEVLPTQSAFTSAEIAALDQWVATGGSLLLIADHMPAAGAAEELAAKLGIVFQNGFAMRPETYEGDFTFRRATLSLAVDAITNGRNPIEQVDSIVSFTGQGFRAVRPVRALMTLDSGVVFFPIRAWQFTEQTPRVSAVGLLQGAAFRHGRGRAAVFGEAAMFSAQRAGRQREPMGMNDPRARQNGQFVLNVMHWLAGILEPDSTGTQP
jgi:hypothetical protein